MLIMPIDMPNASQPVIERDISVFLATSSDKASLPKGFPKKKDLPGIIRPLHVQLLTNSGALTHVGSYGNLHGLLKMDLWVWTVINSGKSKDLRQGIQSISYGNGDIDISVSDSWKYENVDGIIYMKHTHKYFYVYTSDNNQYIIVR